MACRYAGTFRLAFALLAATSNSASAQEAREPPKPLFPQLFPQPTGRNGYEEIVMAADLASAIEYKVDLTSPDLSLTRRREALATPECRQALALLHRGLGKPISSPRQAVTFDTKLPDLARMRSLGRLVAADIRVCFADGRTRDAIGSLQDGLNLAIALHGETLIGSLVAKAIEAVAINTFARHLDQLSAPDCERLLSLAREWERLPDPTIAAAEAELRGQLASLEVLRRNPAAAAETIRAWFGEDVAQGARENPQIQRLLANPAELSAALDRLGGALRSFYASVLTELKRQPWERRAPEVKNDGSLVGEALAAMTPALSAVTSRFTEARARMLLLGVHAGIRRYRWENDRLPGSLEELKLGAVAVDPCSGRPFAYRVTSPTSYELSASGMLPTDGGPRTPIMIPAQPKAPVGE